MIEYMNDEREFYRNEILIALAQNCNRLFKLVQRERSHNFGLLVLQKDNTATDYWYHRLGPLDVVAGFRVGNTERVDEMPHLQALNSENLFTVCQMEKITCTSLKTSTHRKNTPLELNHSDICAPIKSRSLGGCRYLILFVDDCMKYITVYFLKSKDKAASQFQHFNAAVDSGFSDKSHQKKANRNDERG